MQSVNDKCRKPMASILLFYYSFVSNFININGKTFFMKKISIFLFTILILTFSSCRYDKIEEIQTPKKEIAWAYKGDGTCKGCHADLYNMYAESGHPFAMTETKGSQPAIPFTTMAGQNIVLPTSYTWMNIKYLIGGFACRAVFVDNEGYLITGNTKGQYNFLNNTQNDYHASVANGTAKYTCGNCHATGWKNITDGGTAQDDLPGMDGSFAKTGVQCEACHGMGSKHAASKLKSDITIDKTADACAKCHNLNANSVISGEHGFIVSAQQSSEYKSSGHASLTNGCIDCHNPHASARHDDLAKGNGMNKNCTDCHTSSNYKSYLFSAHAKNTCTDCHMPQIVKNGTNATKYRADERSHIFKINVATTSTFYNTDSTIVNADGAGIPLTMVCYRCHADANGNGGSYSKKTLGELLTKGINFHNTK